MVSKCFCSGNERNSVITYLGLAWERYVFGGNEPTEFYNLNNIFVKVEKHQRTMRGFTA